MASLNLMTSCPDLSLRVNTPSENNNFKVVELRKTHKHTLSILYPNQNRKFEGYGLYGPLSNTAQIMYSLVKASRQLMINILDNNSCLRDQDLLS